ncbi:MAG TPA: hypothetical protein VGL05_19325 [Kribbella sp.]
MTLPHVRAACIVVQTLREDWDRRAVEGQVTELADTYDHPDVLYACVVVARDLNNRAPTMLTVKASDIISRLHSKTATVRTATPGRRDEQFLCDVCNKPQGTCESVPTNLDGRDHSFVSIRRAEAERERERAANNPIRVEAKAEVARHKTDLFAMPADIDQPTHPEPEQRDGAA